MDSVLLQYGAIGAITLACLYAVYHLFTKINEQLEHERARSDRLEDELAKLNETIRHEYVGTIVEATRAIADALAAVRKS